MKVLIDTNVVSELRKGARCDPNVATWFAALPADGVYLSALVIGEIRQGIERIRRRDAKAARSLDAWLRKLVATHDQRILPVDRRVAEEWGRINVPNPVPVVDGLMAATAKVHDLILATRNVKDISGTGARIVNPFEVSPGASST